MPDMTQHRARQRDQFRADVIAGLGSVSKSLPSRWLYDDKGSQLFESITRLDEYYLTRAETAILHRYAAEMAGFCGSQINLIEYGAGDAVKTEILLNALQMPQRYLPVDIAGDFLELTALRIRTHFPNLIVQPIIADFTADFRLPEDLPLAGRVGFFPGSTIGNLNVAEADVFLRRMREHAGSSGVALIGFDLVKSLDVLLPAYDDREGVTAEFNLNILHRINRELGADVVVGDFAHEARWNAAESAIEMHLVSRRRQTIHVAGFDFHFEAGETIHTESSRKYVPADFAAVAQRAGWQVQNSWVDPGERFTVCGLQAA